MSEQEYSPLELMAAVLSRELRDGEVGSAGVHALVPLAAMMLARKMHAPGLIIGGERIYNPKPMQLYEDNDDPRNAEGAEAIEGFWETFGYWHKGLDFFFHSGMQIDQFGNMNLHYVGGSFHQPRFRGPGVPNVSLAVSCRRLFLYPLSHTPRMFVEKVDFITLPGHLQGPESKRAAGITTLGPVLCVTPLAVMDFEPESLRMRLKSVHPGVTAEHVQSMTGFPLVMPEQIPHTPPPTERELWLLRNEVDPTGMLRRKVPQS